MKSQARVATLMLHTSPLEQAGTGDAGGMNIYVVEGAIQMAKAGVAVDIFTRARRPVGASPSRPLSVIL